MKSRVICSWGSKGSKGSGGGSPFTGTPSPVKWGLLFRRCWDDAKGTSSLAPLCSSNPGDMRVGEVTKDFGVLPPDCEVRGEGGGLSSMLGVDIFALRLSADLASKGAGEAVSAVITVGAALLRSRAQVTMSVLSSV